MIDKAYGDGTTNYYPGNEQLGDGYANWEVSIVHHEACGPDVIVRNGELIADKGGEEHGDDEEGPTNPMGWVANLTVLVDDGDLIHHTDVDSGWLGRLLGIEEG